ncbi:MAG: hypothetical protein ACOCX4_02755 [Planctomycetota bacterium]
MDTVLTLHNDRLRVDLERPGAAYRRPRYDWPGRGREVVLDGTHRFCQPETLVPNEGSDGHGLCNEFGIFAPVGYADAAPGDWFPKVGVGWLRRVDGEAYGFSCEYPVRPGAFGVERDGETAIRMEATVDPERGYGWRLEKEYRLDGTSLRTTYRLENTGDLPLRTHEYCHNFVGIDGTPTGPGLALCLGFPLAEDALPTGLERGADGLIRWPTPVERAYYGMDKAPGRGRNRGWRLLHEPTGVGIAERLEAPLGWTALFGGPHIACTELFVDIDLAPGASATWRRVHTCFTAADPVPDVG